MKRRELGAYGLDPERVIVAYVLVLGGRPQATALGYGGRAPGCLPSAVALAALVNGTVAHHLALDDGQYVFRVHHS